MYGSPIKVKTERIMPKTGVCNFVVRDNSSGKYASNHGWVTWPPTVFEKGNLPYTLGPDITTILVSITGPPCENTLKEILGYRTPIPFPETLAELSEMIPYFHILKENEIYLPQDGDSICILKGVWHVVQNGYIYRFDYEDVGAALAWCEVREATEYSINHIEEEYLIPLLAHLCDHEIPVEDARTIERLEEWLGDENDWLFLTALQVLLVCAKGWELGQELPARRYEAYLRLKEELI